MEEFIHQWVPLVLLYSNEMRVLAADSEKETNGASCINDFRGRFHLKLPERQQKRKQNPVVGVKVSFTKLSDVANCLYGKKLVYK